MMPAFDPWNDLNILRRPIQTPLYQQIFQCGCSHICIGIPCSFARSPEPFVRLSSVCRRFGGLRACAVGSQYSLFAGDMSTCMRSGSSLMRGVLGGAPFDGPASGITESLVRSIVVWPFGNFACIAAFAAASLRAFSSDHFLYVVVRGTTSLRNSRLSRRATAFAMVH